MATTTQKTPTNGTTDAPPRANGSAAEHGASTTQQDARLLKFTRANIQPIIAGLLAMAARYGEDREYARMQETQAIATQLAQLGGLAASLTANVPVAKAAAASAGTN